MSKSASVRHWLMPLPAFAAVWITQYLWLHFFPGRSAAQERWVSIGLIRAEPWWPRYIHGQAYWLGISYALSAAFAVWAFQEYRRCRCCGTRRMQRICAPDAISGQFFRILEGCSSRRPGSLALQSEAASHV